MNTNSTRVIAYSYKPGRKMYFLWFANRLPRSQFGSELKRGCSRKTSNDVRNGEIASATNRPAESGKKYREFDYRLAGGIEKNTAWDSFREINAINSVE